MINKHTNAALCFDFNGFTKYLTSIAGGQKSVSTAKAIVADIQNYFCFISESHKPHYDLLLDMENLQNYLQYLQQHFSFAATTISEKIRKSLSKDIQKQRHKQSLKSAQKVCS